MTGFLSYLKNCVSEMQSTSTVSSIFAAFLAVLTGCGSLESSEAASTEIERAHHSLAKAFSECNEAAFLDAYAQNFSFLTSNTRKAIVAKDDLRAYLGASCSLRPNPTASIAKQTIRFMGAEALVVGQYMFRIPNGAKIMDVPQNFTLLFVQESGLWKVAAHHVSVAP